MCLIHHLHEVKHNKNSILQQQNLVSLLMGTLLTGTQEELLSTTCVISCVKCCQQTDIDWFLRI